MAIDINRLRASQFKNVRTFATSINEAKSRYIKTAFLCHSHLDRDLVNGVQQTLQDAGITLYVDWQDASMPDSPNRVTAEKIQAKIIQADVFLYLATPNAGRSRWCPWEIGFADGKKSNEKIIVIPVKDGNFTYGAEYLELYRRLDVDSMNRPGIWSPGRNTYYSSEPL